MIVHVFRCRNSKHVAYFPQALEQTIAEGLRHRGGVMHKAQFWRFAAELNFPEVLLQGYCFGRTSKNLPQDTIHEAIEISNEQFATYLPMGEFEKARTMILTDERLNGAAMRFVKVMLPDIEALTHGLIVPICPVREISAIQKFAHENFLNKYGLMDIDRTDKKLVAENLHGYFTKHGLRQGDMKKAA